MTPPVLITPPSAPVVTMDDLRAHLRVVGTYDDAVIGAYYDAAVGYLDGPRGILGRAIREQTWQVTVEGPGPHLLPVPDVIAVSVAEGGDPVVVDQEPTLRGLHVTLPEGTETADITFTSALPAQQLPLAQAAVKLLVAHWYEHREAVGSAAEELPLAFGALVAALKWRKA
jgi:uncharacterized phiE125 gp8 family phage protein